VTQSTKEATLPHTGDNIPSPKPLFSKDLLEKELKRGVRRILLGSKVNGICIDVSPDGLTINGYYEGTRERGMLYANIRNPVEIEWTELDRLHKIVIEDIKPKKRKKKPKKEGNLPHLIDEEPDEDYLDTLPIVTMNEKKYFIDIIRKERRAVDDTSKVYPY
jgi:hypothetical protein